MFLFILAIAILNLALGYAVAVWLHAEQVAQVATPRPLEPPSASPAPAAKTTPAKPPSLVPDTPDELSREEASEPRHGEADLAAESQPKEHQAEAAADAPPELQEPEPGTEEPQPLRRHTPELPAEWIDLLGVAVATKPFVEASIQVLRLQVGRYRDQLIHFDGQIRDCLRCPDTAVLEDSLSQLKKANEVWLARQGEAADHLKARQGHLDGFDQVGGGLEAILLEQATQIKTACGNIELLDFRSNQSAGCQRLLDEIARLIDLCHILRDRMQESLLVVMKHTGRLESLERHLATDPKTDLCNRIGLEQAVVGWWRDDPGRRRLATIAVFDIDRLGEVNREFGPLLGDRLIAQVARMIDKSLRQHRGCDVAARFSGQQMVVFLGDTGPRNATSAAERIRQMVFGSSFTYGEEPIEVSVHCGVTEATETDTTETLFRRLRQTARAARKAGGNCTFLHNGTQAEAVQPPEYNVPARVIKLDIGDV